MIRAITLDLWDTVIHDDTDEPKRAAAGLAPKPAARRALMRDALATHCGVPAEIADTAYDVTDAAFNQVWHEQHVTWSVEERLSVLLGGLRRELPEAAVADVVARIERMELEFMPDPVPGIGEAIETRMRALRLLGHPYTDEQIEGAAEAVAGRTEMDAMIAYLQGLGTAIRTRR